MISMTYLERLCFILYLFKVGTYDSPHCQGWTDHRLLEELKTFFLKKTCNYL